MSFWRENMGLLPPDESDPLLLNADTPGWCAANAFSLGNLSALAYEPENEVRRFLGKRGWETLNYQIATHRPFLKAWTETCWFAAGKGGDMVLVFRGTEPTNLLNWATNLACAPVAAARFIPGAAGRVHTGFGEAFLRVWQELDNTLRTFEREGGKRLWLAGHSLGGALAFLCAAAVSLAAPPFQWFHLKGLYTYGQPRTGDPSFIECITAQMEADYFRVVHGSDIVPHVPPEFLTAGFPGVRPNSGKNDAADYAHGGTLVFLPPGAGPASASMPQRTPLSLKQILLRMLPAIRQSPGVVIEGRNPFSRIPKEILHHFLRGTKPEHTAYVSRLRALWPALNP